MLGADPRDPRIIKVLNELDANDNYRNTVARSLLPVDDPFVQQYVTNTTSSLHNYKLQVESVFQINCLGDRDFKVKFSNHKLLWFGATPEAVYPILRDGFQSSFSVQNGFFGRGIYFTDCATKAANLTSTDANKLLGPADKGDTKPAFDQTGYLFLAEVSLGRMKECKEPDENAKALLSNADSVYGRGSWQPDGEYVMRNTDIKIVLPMGNLKEIENLHLKHNEWVVYSGEQIRHRYLVKALKSGEYGLLLFKASGLNLRRDWNRI